MQDQRVVQGVIVALGAVALVLAVIVDDHEALSVVFGFGGIGAVILGMILPQLVDFELSTTGIKGKFLRELQGVAQDDELTLTEKGDNLSGLLLDGRNSPRTSGTSGNDPIRPAIVAMPPFHWPEPPAPGVLLTRHVGRDFAAHVRKAFESAGWTVKRVPRRVFGDFVAEKDGDIRLVEAKASRHLSAADLSQIAAQHAEHEAEEPMSWILVVPASSLSAEAIRVVAELRDFEIAYVPVADDGQAETVTPQSPG